jgi:pyruvate,water dikinase
MIKRIGSPMPFVSRQLYGGKGKNLLELGESFPVPEGFVVSSEIYVDFFVQNNLKTIIEDVLAKNKDPKEIEKRARDAITNAKFSKTIEDSVKREYDMLTAVSKDPIAVRSSAIDEDGAARSFAGQHDSFFGNFDINALFNYIKLCYASAFNAVALKYRKDHGLELPSGMAVVIQAMKEFEAGFVMYTAAPMDYDHMLIEAAPGHCKAVVDGMPVDCYKVGVRRGDIGTIDEKVSKNKSQMWTFDRATGKLVIVPIPKKYQFSGCLMQEQVKQIAETGVDVEKCYALEYPSARKPQDIEGGIALDGRLWLTQSRDITGMNLSAKDIVLPVLSKLVAESYNVGCGGIYDGPVVIVESVDPNGTDFALKQAADIRALDKKFSSGYVLITPETNPTLDYHLNHCKAIVATDCGIMSHAGATARERGLIFVGCAEVSGNRDKKLQQILDHGDVVCVGANKEKGIIGYR